MCLTVTVELLGVSPRMADAIAQACSASGALAVTPLRGGSKDRHCRFALSEPGEGCACSLLAESGSRSEDVWDLRPGPRNQLAAVLQCLAGRAHESLVFEARWRGDALGEERQLPLRELISRVRENRVGTATRYVSTS